MSCSCTRRQAARACFLPVGKDARRVIGTVSSEAKAELARANGCDEVIVTRDYKFASRMSRRADVIYDGLGRAAAPENFAALAMRGHWVSYGRASGPLQPLSLAEVRDLLAAGPLSLHRHAPAEMASNAIPGHCAMGRSRRGECRHRYPLAAASDAHRDLEARRTSGQVVLLTWFRRRFSEEPPVAAEKRPMCSKPSGARSRSRCSRRGAGARRAPRRSRRGAGRPSAPFP